MAAFVQSFACLEIPVAKNYQNKKKTIGNPDFPLWYMMESFCDDSLCGLALMLGTAISVTTYLYFIFKPTPVVVPGIVRPIKVKLTHHTITESNVQWISDGL